ncbi:MAG: iron export ABC transporter permease subunit FetB [Planctomycetota bacterium]|nr:MAG: iron export ABC transporter permease subunit FetB [Planctomycetota bacterium]
MILRLAAAPLLDPGWSGLALAGLLMLVVVVLATALGIRMLRLGLVATVRTTVQLLAVGFVLQWVFARSSWAWIAAVLALMTCVAGWTGRGRVERPLRGLGPALTLVLAGVLAVTLLYVSQLVVGARGPDPRYLIPLGGMILGNAMTAASLAAARFHDELRSGRDLVEAALGLGATPWQATAQARARAFRAALTPTVNAMLIVGIVKLPGVMTGQMLGGADPLQAAKYQIVVMFMLAFSDGVSALLVLKVLQRLAFTRAWQPRL